MWTSNDALGMALVTVGAATEYFIKRFWKRASDGGGAQLLPDDGGHGHA